MWLRFDEIFLFYQHIIAMEWKINDGSTTKTRLFNLLLKWVTSTISFHIEIQNNRNPLSIEIVPMTFVVVCEKKQFVFDQTSNIRCLFIFLKYRYEVRLMLLCSWCGLHYDTFRCMHIEHSSILRLCTVNISKGIQTQLFRSWNNRCSKSETDTVSERISFQIVR